MWTRPPNVLLRGGSIYSPLAPHATAMLTVRGTIAWLGDDSAADQYADEAHQVVDLQGRLVTPGFVDAHAHLAQTGFALQSVDLGSAHSLEEMLDALAAYAKGHEGSVLFAQGWDETRWPQQRIPSLSEIDRAVGNKIAYIARVDSHSAVISTALLQRRPDLKELDGWRGDGTVERDAHHAARAVADELRTAADRSAALLTALDHAASLGVTSLHELNAPHIAPLSDLSTLKDLRAEFAVPEVVPYWGELLGGAGVDEPIVGFAGDLCMDGAIGSRTAALEQPYADRDTSGYLYLDERQVRDHVVLCTRRGVQAGFHVIGDRALREVMAGFQAAASEVGQDAILAARHRLEHVEMPTRDDIDAMARLGIVASVQPAFDAAWGGDDALYAQRLGRERASAMNPFATMHRAGVVLAFGSDSPVTPVDPWGTIRAAAFHHREDERLSVRAAFNAHTRGGHRARRFDMGGVLAPGAHATYVVWDIKSELSVQTPDVRVAAWSTDARAGVPVLPDVHPDVDLPICVETVVGGVPIYTAEQVA
ncbi:MAG: amidohydrolase [Nocardioidaceae bacterium]|nr:amidohydrolase [Nocardioidaceae bacterium]